MRNLGLPPQCIWDLRSPDMLHSTDWYLVIDISEQLIGDIFKGQGVQEEWT